MKKTCRKCKEPKLTTEFNNNRSSSDGLHPICKECRKEETKRFRQRRKGELAAYQRLIKAVTKEEVFSHYGNGQCICAKCGFKDIRALTIDHINGDGGQHRKEVKRGGMALYRWIKKNSYPTNLQVLCMNCQFIKRHENNEHNAHKKPGSIG